jgi:hypothetical protein
MAYFHKSTSFRSNASNNVCGSPIFVMLQLYLVAMCTNALQSLVKYSFLGRFTHVYATIVIDSNSIASNSSTVAPPSTTSPSPTSPYVP